MAVTGTTATSFLTVYPTGEARPLAANLNCVAGDTVSNRVMAKLGAGGKVTIYNDAGSTDVVVDVDGWYTDASVAGTTGVFTPLAAGPHPRHPRRHRRHQRPARRRQQRRRPDHRPGRGAGDRASAR